MNKLIYILACVYVIIFIIVMIVMIKRIIYLNMPEKNNHNKKKKSYKKQKIKFRKVIIWENSFDDNYSTISSNYLYKKIMDFCSQNNINLLDIKIPESDFGYISVIIKGEEKEKVKLNNFLISDFSNLIKLIIE